MKKSTIVGLFLLFACSLFAQHPTVSVPREGGNLKSSISQQIGITNIELHWDAPGVKGREGKVWGTTVAHFGFQDLGFGTSKAAPWRAGANECTTISFSTAVEVEGKSIPAGKYGFFMAVYPDSCTLIFSKNNTAWGSYFYNPAEDVLRVTVRQQKSLSPSRERLIYTFSEQTENSAVIALEWEHWRIPFKISMDLTKVVLETLRQELQGEKGFLYQNWYNAALFCIQNNTNLEEALVWAETGVSSYFGQETFATLSMKAQVQEKLGRAADAETTMQKALPLANAMELHLYGRQLLADKKPAKALEVFKMNFEKFKGAWPTHVGLMRGYSANGDLKKALEHAKIALAEAPDEINRKTLQAAIKTLSEGKPL